MVVYSILFRDNTTVYSKYDYYTAPLVPKTTPFMPDVLKKRKSSCKIRAPLKKKGERAHDKKIPCRYSCCIHSNGSVPLVGSCGEEPGRTWFVWETKDGVYQEWGTDISQYETDREVCQQPSRKLSTLNSLSPVTAARRFSPAIKTADLHVCTSATNRKAVPQRVILMHIPICGVM